MRGVVRRRAGAEAVPVRPLREPLASRTLGIVRRESRKPTHDSPSTFARVQDAPKRSPAPCADDSTTSASAFDDAFDEEATTTAIEAPEHNAAILASALVSGFARPRSQTMTAPLARGSQPAMQSTLHAPKPTSPARCAEPAQRFKDEVLAYKLTQPPPRSSSPTLTTADRATPATPSRSSSPTLTTAVRAKSETLPPLRSSSAMLTPAVRAEPAVPSGALTDDADHRGSREADDSAAAAAVEGEDPCTAATADHATDARGSHGAGDDVTAPSVVDADARGSRQVCAPTTTAIVDGATAATGSREPTDDAATDAAPDDGDVRSVGRRRPAGACAERSRRFDVRIREGPQLVIEHAVPHSAAPSPNLPTPRAHDTATSIERTFEAPASRRRRRLLPGIAVGAAGIVLVVGLLGKLERRCGHVAGRGLAESGHRDARAVEPEGRVASGPHADAKRSRRAARSGRRGCSIANDEAETVRSEPAPIHHAGAVRLEPAVRRELAPEVRADPFARVRRRHAVRAAAPTPSRTSPTATSEDLDSPFPK